MCPVSGEMGMAKASGKHLADETHSVEADSTAVCKTHSVMASTAIANSCSVAESRGVRCATRC